MITETARTAALDFFEYAFSAFKLAEKESRTSVKKYYRVADMVICLHFANDALVPVITLALDHLAAQPREHPDLTVYLGDNKTTKTKLCLPHDFFTSYNRKGEIPGYSDENIYVTFDRDTGSLSLYDQKQQIAFFWTQTNKLPWWAGGSPLRFILHLSLNSKNYQLTHAGAVGTENGAVILSGKGGKGKSTTVLTCLDAGLKYISEDYCILGKNKNKPYVYSIYNSAKLDEKTLKTFPHLASAIKNPHRGKNEKALIFQHSIYPEKIVNQLPIKAILALERKDNRETHLTPISKEKALQSLTPSTLHYLPHTTIKTLHILKEAVSSTPCYQLSLGQNRKTIAQIIQKLLQS